MTTVFSPWEIPFSYHGSWFCFSPVVAGGTYAEEQHVVSRLIDLAYESVDTVRVRGRGLGLRLLAADPVLTPFSGPYFYQDPVDGSYVLTLYQTGRRYRITLLAGRAEHLGAQALGAAERGI